MIVVAVAGASLNGCCAWCSVVVVVVVAEQHTAAADALIRVRDVNRHTGDYYLAVSRVGDGENAAAAAAAAAQHT